MLPGHSISMYKRGLSFVNCLLIAFFINGSLGQDISFPDGNYTVIRHRFDVKPEEPTTTEPTIAITMKFIPLPMMKCRQNMIVDNENGTAFCECLEGYMYYPKLDECYPVYMRGPCQDGYYFVLQANETVAKCIRNPCKKENEVLYEGSCYGLLSSGGPCPPNKSLVISETTYKPACESVRAVNYQVITAPLKPCAPGSRRAGRGLCRAIL